MLEGWAEKSLSRKVLEPENAAETYMGLLRDRGVTASIVLSDYDARYGGEKVLKSFD